jgi:peptidoglycan hydrolase-like protein with peptidoglycan-binding domain
MAAAAVIDLNYLSGEADGIFGAQTKEALKRFQSAGALATDGIAGRDVMARLEP